MRWLVLISSISFASPNFFFELPNAPKSTFNDFKNQFILHNVNKAYKNAKKNEPSLSKTVAAVENLRPKNIVSEAPHVVNVYGFDLGNLKLFNYNKIYGYDVNQYYLMLNNNYNLEIKYKALATFINIRPRTYNLGVAITKTFK